MNKIKLILIAVCVLMLSISAVNCADYNLYQDSDTRTTDWENYLGLVVNFANYTGANAYGGSGLAVESHSGTGNRANGYLILTDYTPNFIASNQCFIEIWYHIETSSGTSATQHVGLEYNGVDVATYTSGSVTSLHVDGYLNGWVNPIAGASLRVHIVTSVNKAVEYVIDEIRISFSETPHYDTQIQLIDEATDSHLATFTGFTLIPVTDISGDSLECSTLIDYLTAYTFTNNMLRLEVEYDAIERWYYLTEDSDNNVVVTLTPTEYTVAVVDNSDTYGANTHYKAIREIGGVNMTVDEKILSWSKLCYTGLVTGNYYVITLTNPSASVFTYGNVSVVDNPIYIVLNVEGDTVTLYNINQTQFFNYSIASNFTTPSDLGTQITADFQDYESYEWGHYGLMILPFIVMAIATRKFMFIFGSVATGLCLALNVAVGYEMYSTSVLSIAFVFNIICLYDDWTNK